MKVTGGDARGRRLASRRLPGLRPSAARVREALFDILGGRIRDAEVLDLYAGTGAVGLEALSRGARRVHFVDIDPRAVRLIEENVARGGWEGAAVIVRGDADAVAAQLRSRGEVFDIAYLDPPYATVLSVAALQGVAGLVRAGGVVVVEHAAGTPPGVEGLRTLRPGRSYRYGDSGLTVLHRPAVPATGGD